MSKFSDFLSSLTGRPKNFDHASATITEAKTTLDSVSALFTAAGLNIEQMLAAGPDALKAHLASLDNSAEVTRLTGELTTAKADLDTSKQSIASISAQLKTYGSVASTIGITDMATASPESVLKAFDTHIAKATTLALAKTGHPPAHVPAVTEPGAAQTDADLLAEYQSMKPGPARLAFFSKHEAAIRRAAKLD